MDERDLVRRAVVRVIFAEREIFSTITYINENSGFVKVLFGSCVLAFALNYSIFLNTSVNSAR